MSFVQKHLYLLYFNNLHVKSYLGTEETPGSMSEDPDRCPHACRSGQAAHEAARQTERQGAPGR